MSRKPTTILNPKITITPLDHGSNPRSYPAPPSRNTRINSIQAVKEYIQGCSCCNDELFALRPLGRGNSWVVCRVCSKAMSSNRKRKLPAKEDEPTEGGSHVQASSLMGTKKLRPMTGTSKTKAKEGSDEDAVQDQNHSDSSDGDSHSAEMITARNARLKNKKVLMNIKNLQRTHRQEEPIYQPTPAAQPIILQIEKEQAVFLWKVNQMSRKMRDAKDSSGVYYSSVFRIGQSGYEMRAKLCLNSEGKEEGSYVAFLIALRKGACDALLRWPFRQKVTLTLVDQKGTDHLEEPFWANPGSPSFQRPTTEGQLNVAYGCPQFVGMVKLQGDSPYVLGDTAAFKVAVGTKGMLI